MFGFIKKIKNSNIEKHNFKGDFKACIPNLLFFVCTVLFYELALAIVLHWGHINVLNLLTVILFSIPVACFFFFITNLFGKRANLILHWVALAFLTVVFETYLIYYKIFGSYMSVFLVTMGGDAITGFWDQLAKEITDDIFYCLIFLVPLIVFPILLKFNVITINKRPYTVKITSVISVFLVHIICVSMLFVGGTRAFSLYTVYFGNDTDKDRSCEALGVLTAARLELTHMLLGGSFNSIEEGEANEPTDLMTDTDVMDLSYNILEEIDFKALNEKTNNSAIVTLNNYFAGKAGTNKNEYTGYFKDKNLIVLCCESFSPYIISEELTPTLYKMSTNGFVFNNFYNSYPNNTTNGEYTLCMGMFPDLSRSKSNGSFKYSADNYLPFCLGRMFENQGVKSHAYHNYKGSYYAREDTHPNMGYSSFKSADNGMTFTTDWPASDLEMMQQSVDDYINQDRFHAYYMTFSGHYQYNFTTNPMCIRNYDKVKDLPYSDTVKAFISCNLELEAALTYLVDRLEQAGKLDDTVIALTNDHYPYGLTDDEYNELAGKEIDTAFEKYKNSFICWNSAMKEPVQVDEYCCTPDILPTLLNLFGMKYDSRMLVGVDVLSANNHIAIINNQSFLCKNLKFDSETNKVTYFADKSTLSDNYLESLINTVKNRMTVSSIVLNTDYYRFVWENTYPDVNTNPALPEEE